MKHNLLLLLLHVLSVLGCSSVNEPSNNVDDPSSKVRKYFEYDAIEHFKLEVDESSFDQLYFNEERTGVDSMIFGVVFGDIPESFNELGFIDYLPKIGYRGRSLDQSLFSGIDSLFVEKERSEEVETSCIVVYRDILVFKKERKVTGTAKICLECLSSQLKGLHFNTAKFGQLSEYAHLARLLQD